MATILSFTSEQILALMDSTFGGASVNGAGNLIVTTRGGKQQDLGPIIAAGNNTQYYRGDKQWATLDKMAVGLNNVDNVSVVADYVPKWKPNTAYAAGFVVITPTNQVMSSNSAHTSSPSFTTDYAKWDGPGQLPYGHMGRTAGFISLGGAITTIPMDVVQELRGGMLFDNPNDALIPPLTGRYHVHLKGFFSGAAAGVNQTGIKVNGATPNGINQKVISAASKMDGNDIFVHSSGTIPLNAGDKVSMYEYSSVSAWGTNGYDGAFLELSYVGTL